MIRKYGKYLIIKSEEINDDLVFLVGANLSDGSHPYVCLTHYRNCSGPDSTDNVQCHKFYAEALADLYSRCASDYSIDFEQKALRDALEQGKKNTQEDLEKEIGLEQ